MPPASPSTILVALPLYRPCTIGHLLQQLIDDTPMAHRELLAYALFRAYLTIRLPNEIMAPEPDEQTILPPGHKRRIILNNGVFIFDFGPPTLLPRGTVAEALDLRRAIVYLFTQPPLTETWASCVRTWPRNTRKRIEIRTVPDWLCLGIGLMTIGSRDARRPCLNDLIRRANHCLAQFPAPNLRIVTKVAPRGAP